MRRLWNVPYWLCSVIGIPITVLGCALMSAGDWCHDMALPPFKPH